MTCVNAKRAVPLFAADELREPDNDNDDALLLDGCGGFRRAAVRTDRESACRRAGPGAAPSVNKRLPAVAAVAVVLGVTASGACASESVDVADRGGFLIGHAFRCGVAEEYLDKSAKIVRSLVDALATDDQNRDDATAQFAESFLTGAIADPRGGHLPSCETVRREVLRLDHHRFAIRKVETDNTLSDKQAAQIGGGPIVMPSAARRHNKQKLLIQIIETR